MLVSRQNERQKPGSKLQNRLLRWQKLILFKQSDTLGICKVLLLTSLFELPVEVRFCALVEFITEAIVLEPVSSCRHNTSKLIHFLQLEGFTHVVQQHEQSLRHVSTVQIVGKREGLVVAQVHLREEVPVKRQVEVF